MAGSYTLKRLTEVEDSAGAFGLGEIQEARFANDELELEDTGVSLHRLRAGKRQGFAHRHHNAEEVYVMLAGAGRLKLDDDIVDVQALDAIRVAAGVTRSFEAGSDNLEFLAFGPRHEGDGEVVPDWWTD